MSIIAAKCSACGAPLETDGTRSLGYCPYCGSKYLTGEGGRRSVDGPDAFYERFSAFETLGHTAEAASVAEEMTKKYPQSALSWICLARVRIAQAGERVRSAESQFTGDRVHADNGKEIYFPMSCKAIRSRYGSVYGSGAKVTDSRVRTIAADYYAADSAMGEAYRTLEGAAKLPEGENEDLARETRDLYERTKERLDILSARIDRSAAAHNRSKKIAGIIIVVAAIVMAIIVNL